MAQNDISNPNGSYVVIIRPRHNILQVVKNLREALACDIKTAKDYVDNRRTASLPLQEAYDVAAAVAEAGGEAIIENDLGEVIATQTASEAQQQPAQPLRTEREKPASNVTTSKSNIYPINNNSLYSEKLERLIQMSIEDGVVDDASWAVLLRKANEEGVDPDELTLYVNSLLKKQNRAKNAELTQKAQVYELAKRETIGNICPKCGQQVPPMSIVCPYCGMKIVNKEGNSSVKDLLEKIATIRRQKGNRKDIELQVRDTITLYPVPSTNEDLVEFLSISVSESKKKINWFNTAKARVILFTAFCIITLPLLGLGLLIGLYGLLFWAVRGNDGVKNETLEEEGYKMQLKQTWEAKTRQLLLRAHNIQGDATFHSQIQFYEKEFNKGILSKLKSIFSRS